MTADSQHVGGVIPGVPTSSAAPESQAPTPAQHHYLVLVWAEEPESGTFTDDLDWTLSHPPTCEFDPEMYGVGIGGGFKCALEWETSNIGVDVFGRTSKERASCWSSVPAVFAVEHWHEAIRFANGVEHDTGIRPVEPPSAPSCRTCHH